jgi:hypothetical protein
LEVSMNALHWVVAIWVPIAVLILGFNIISSKNSLFRAPFTIPVLYETPNVIWKYSWYVNSFMETFPTIPAKTFFFLL